MTFKAVYLEKYGITRRHPLTALKRDNDYEKFSKLRADLPLEELIKLLKNGYGKV